MWQKIKNIYHLGNAFLANLWFGFPSRSHTVIGITGTDGKTTTVSLIYHILHSAGYNASMISSVGAIIGGKKYDVGFHVTTPSPWSLQGFIKKAFPTSATPRSRFLVLEITSHAIDQNRIWGIPFDIGVLTNITHEHLDYHKTYENYVKTKAKLLKRSKVAIVNKDDSSYKFVIVELKVQNSKLQRKAQNLRTYGIGSNAYSNPKTFPFRTKLIGEFNKYNILAAVGACKALGINDKDIRRGIESFVPPIGREEIVYKKDFTVMIDFAHTPNAFDQILSSIRLSIEGRLIHVFGAAGERDVSKRSLMGQASAKYADVIILTAEDPRSESVGKIINDIESGITNSKFETRNSKQFSKFEFLNIQNKKKYIFKIPNRQDAINAAIRMARKGDFVLITGKSHEKSMNYGRGEEPWDEYAAVTEAIIKRK